MNSNPLAHVSQGAFRRVGLIARQEVIKGFLNRRGLVALLAFVLVWGLILFYPIRQAASYLADPDVRQWLSSLLMAASPRELLSWEVPELAIFWVISLYWFPLFAILSSADQFASDKSRKTLRFLVQRTGREPLFIGRVLGQLLSQASYILIAGLATLLLILFRDASLLPAALRDGLLVLLNLLIVITPYIALMALLSLYASSARQATLLAVFIWCVINILSALISYYLPSAPSLDWLLPGSQVSLMIDNSPMGALAHSPAPLLQSGVLVMAGLFYMRRIAL